MDEQVFVRLENGEIIPLQSSDIQGSSYIIQQPVDPSPDAGAEPVVMEDVDYESNNAEKVVYIVNQEGTSLEGMQFTVFGDDGADGQTLTLQTIVSGDNSVNYTNISNSLTAPDIAQSSIPVDQHMSAIEALSRVAVSEHNGSQTIVAGDINQTYNDTCAADTGTTSEIPGETNQDSVENVNFTFYCQECNAATEDLDSFKQHLLNEHGILEPEKDNEGNNDVTLLPSCTVCSKTFLDHNELSEHMKSTPCGGNNYIVAGADDRSRHVVQLPTLELKCRHCTDKFSSKDELADHMASSHPGKSLKDSSNTNMFTKCPYCHKMYVHRGVNKALINHILTAHPGKYPLEDVKTEEKITCKFCGVDFYWKKSMIRHMKQSHPDEFSVEGDEIMTELGLQEVHYPKRRVRRSAKAVDEKEDIVIMKCQSCPKSFLWEKSLKRHMMDAHNEEYKESVESKKNGPVVYKCPYCRQVSKYACAVRKHVSRKHKSLVKNIDVNKMVVPKIQAAGVEVKTVDKRPVEIRLNLCRVIYRCPFCSYASKQTSNLNRHLTSKIHGHIFTNEELKFIGLSSFRVQKKPPDLDKEREKIDGTSVSSLPKLKMKKDVLDFVMQKYEILKQRNLADKENTNNSEDNVEYNDLDIENVIAVAEEESEESFDEDDFDNDIKETDTEIDDFANEDNSDEVNGQTSGIDDGAKALREAAEVVDEGSNTDAKVKLADIANKDSETLDTKNQASGADSLELSINCIVCKKAFDSFTQFKKHLHSHVNLKVTFDCMECQEKFSFSKDILKHLKVKHNITTKELEAKYLIMSKMTFNRKPLLTYDCPYCDMLFSQSGPLYQHVVEDHLECIDAAGIKSERDSIMQGNKRVIVTAYRCQFCECSFHNITDIVKHMGIIHGEVEKTNKKRSIIRKSGRKRKVPKWLEDEIELSNTSKRFRDDEELDTDSDDWTMKQSSVSPRKKPVAKFNKTNTSKSAKSGTKRNVLQTTGENILPTTGENILQTTEENSDIASDKNDIPDKVPDVLESTIELKETNADHSLPPKPKTAKRKSKGDATNQLAVVNNTVTINKCPHCNFTAKRASALSFHINFNHAGIEIKKEPEDPVDDNYGNEPRDNEINKLESSVSLKSTTALQPLNGTSKDTTDSLDDNANEDDLFDEDIDFGDSDDDFIPLADDKDGHEDFGFSASVKLGCPYCNDGFFSTFSQVKEHVHEQHPDKSEKFSITDVKTKVEIDDNIKLSNLLKTCHYCKKKFRGNSEIRAHIKEEHGNGVEIKFTKLDKKRKPGANSEALSETEDKFSYRCSFCSKQYDIAENAVRHVHELHSDKKQVTILVESSNEVTEGFKCPYCVMKSKYKRCIVRHVSRAHKDIKNFHKRDIIVIGREAAENTTYYQCSFCGFESKYKNTVSQHMGEMHPNECATIKSSIALCNTLDYLIDYDDGEDYFKCNFCDTVFETKSEVASHVASDHQKSDFDEKLVEKLTNENYLADKSVYKCPVCDQGSKWLVATVRHMKISHPELKEYKVEKCILENEDDGNSVFRCKVCNGFFNTRRGIVQHFMSVHGKEEKYEIVNLDTVRNSVMEQFCCPYCEYRASEKKAIIKHVAFSHPDLKKIKTKDVIHVVEDAENLTDTGGYQCPYCNVVNHWRKSIIRHIRTVHYGKPYDVHIEYKPNAALPAYGSTARKSSKLIECLICGTIRRSVKTMKQHFHEKHRKCVKDFLNKEYTKFKYATTKLVNGNAESEALTPLTNGGRVLHHGCVLCGAKYVWKKSLLVHIKNHHKDMYEVYQTMDQVIDIVCNAAGDFTKPRLVEADVAQPMVENAPLRPKTRSSRKVKKRCKKCQKIFTTTLAARIHKKLHHKTNRFFRFSCNSCCLSFSTGSKLRIHKIIQHKYKKSGSWQCTTCNYRCKYWSLLQNHFMREHAPKHMFPIDQGVYKCEICSKVFSSSQFLKQHLAMHKKTRTPTFQCPACRQHFSSMVSRDTHIEHEHADMTEMCDICGEMFTKRNLKMHVRSHNEPHHVINCTFCKKPIFEKTFNRHVLNYHSDLDTCTCAICSSDIHTTPEGSSKCRICLKNTCHKVALYVHMKFNHADVASSKLFQCEMCPDKYFSSKQLRDAHCHKHHKRDLKSTSVSQLSARSSNIGNSDPTTHVIHIGQDEGKQFLPKLSETSMNAVLKELIVFERGSKNPHKCLLCGRSFSKLKYIKLHVRRAHVRDEDQPYRCKVCGSGFVRLTEFRKHTRSHSDFRPYKCNYCDKAFKQQANLTDHYRVHANTKSYQCFICKTTFRQRGGLTSHVVFHDTLKPYKCMYCNKGYTTRGELSRHMQKYNRDGDGLSKSYQCHLCEDSFPHYPMLMKHIELHSPEKPFQCHMCNATFSSFVTMYFHKVDQGHFFQEDLDQGMKDLQERGRKFRAKRMESQLLMTEYGRNEAENELTDEIMYVNQADGSLQNEAGVKPVEIIIEEFGKDHVVHVQESEPEHEELLSIAKQLTELSGFTETEVQTSVKKNLYQEEDEIIKHMLDADEDVLASLNKSKMYNNGVAERNVEQVEHFNERIDDSFSKMNAGDINVKGDNQGEPNVSYDNQTLPTTMEELVSIVSQNVTPDGNEQVMAYQSEDGSLIYVCLPEGDDKTKEIILEQGAAEEQYVANEVSNVVHDQPEGIDTENVTQIVSNDFNNDIEVGCDIETRNEADIEETYVEQSMLTSESHSQEINQVHTIKSRGDEYVQIPIEGLQQVATGEINPNELNTLQRELTTDQNVTDMSSTEPSVLPNDIQTYTSAEVVVPQGDNLGNVRSAVKPVIAEELDVEYDENTGEGQVHNYAVTEQADASYEEMVEPGIEDAEESREALLRRSQLAQHLTGNIPSSSASSSGSTHMIFTGEGLQTITSSVSDVYANSESLQTDNVSQSLINIAAAAAKIDDNAKHDIANGSVASTENVIKAENTETVVEYHIDEARFIKEELLDTSFSAASGSGESAKAAAAEVMFVSDNIYTYSQAEKKFICLHCGQKVGSFKNLKNHIRRHAPESARIHKCNYCNKRFVTKNEWKRHTWIHTGERNYECKYCGKKFIQPGHLAEHVRLHTGKKPFNCNVCKHAFNTQSQLKLHWSRLHSTTKIPCPQCDKVFKNNIDLKRHKGLEHMGVKKKRAPKAPATTGDNICDICGTSFLKKSGLKLHLERHNLENASSEEQERFSCGICGSSFKSKYYASEHVKSVHGNESNEVCEACGMAFKTKLLLRRHRDLKHSEAGSKWQCKMCNKPFASSSALAYHVGSKH